MSDAVIIDGKAFAADLRAEVGRRAALLKEQHGLVPGLSVVLVGDDREAATSTFATRARRPPPPAWTRRSTACPIARPTRKCWRLSRG